jgi:hypothetical protein
MSANRSWPSRMRQRTSIAGAVIVLGLVGIVATAFASERARAAAQHAGAASQPTRSTSKQASSKTKQAHAASSSGSAPRCVPTELNRSAVLPGTTLAVSPLPDSYDASAYTQLSMLGAPASAIHITSVAGSQSGRHSGSLRGYAQGDGASFVPSKHFDLGESVTVHGSVTSGAATHPFAYSFVVAVTDTGIYSATAAAVVPHDYNEEQHFHSAPALEPPVVLVTAHSPQAAPGDIFSTPYSGPGPSGPMILDEAGNVVWFHPLGGALSSTNLQVQQLNGAPVLTWWQGIITEQGFGQGEEIIENSSYQQIGRVLPGNGFKADLHDFHITPQGTALLTVFHPIACNLSAYGGPASGDVTDGIIQELDLHTGLVRREWHSLDHVAPSASYSSPAEATPHWPFDYFHPNSIDQLAAGSSLGAITLISARNTSALYEINTETGQLVASIGGKTSTVHLAAGASTAYQHDATVLSNGTISLFDNGGVPKVHSQSRGLVLSIDPQTNTDSVVAEYEHPTPIASGSQGDVQVQEDGNVFMGWGAEPYFSEFSASGQLLFDAHMHGSYESYRTYRFPWSAAPGQPPSIAVTPRSSRAHTTVYASWNGDTQTTGWRVLGGASPRSLAALTEIARGGFETAIPISTTPAYVAVQALNSSGAILRTSATIHG